MSLRDLLAAIGMTLGLGRLLGYEGVRFVEGLLDAVQAGASPLSPLFGAAAWLLPRTPAVDAFEQRAKARGLRAALRSRRVRELRTDDRVHGTARRGCGAARCVVSLDPDMHGLLPILVTLAVVASLVFAAASPPSDPSQLVAVAESSQDDGSRDAVDASLDGTADDVPRLAHLLKHGSPDQRAAAMTALGYLVSRIRDSLPYSGRGIPPRGVAHRSLMADKLALRALRSGRRARNLCHRISDPGH